MARTKFSERKQGKKKNAVAARSKPLQNAIEAAARANLSLANQARATNKAPARRQVAAAGRLNRLTAPVTAGAGRRFAQPSQPSQRKEIRDDLDAFLADDDDEDQGDEGEQADVDVEAGAGSDGGEDAASDGGEDAATDAADDAEEDDDAEEEEQEVSEGPQRTAAGRGRSVAAGGVAKKKKRKGAAMRRMFATIRNAQKSCDMLLPFAPMVHVLRTHLNEAAHDLSKHTGKVNKGMRMTRETAEAYREVMQEFAICYMSDCRSAASHGKRITVMDRDAHFIRQIKSKDYGVVEGSA